MKTITPWLSSLLALGLMGAPTLHAPLGAQMATTSTLEADTAATTTTLAPTTATTPTLRVSRDAGNFDRLRFNFKSVPLDTVLDYLSREAGFVIIKSVSVEGTVDLVSHQPMTRTEAVALLNTVLNEKGYAAIRNDRTLTIVSRSDARQRDIPVHVGNAPETIPKSDEMVTQIIPIRYAKAEELIASIKDLLPSYATLSSNASSNAIVLTGTQTDIRRIAEIVRALDSSISSISTLRVFHLQFADSKETANLITSLFQSSSTSNRQNSNSNNPFARFRGGPFGGFGGGPGGGDSNSQNSQTTPAESAALQASSRVVAAADERTNSVVVSAPDDLDRQFHRIEY
jgi:general secretion pathway protein D